MKSCSDSLALVPFLSLMLLSVALLPDPACAGANRGGVLLLHAQPEIVYTTTDADHCDLSLPSDCASAETELGIDRVTIVSVLAAFDAAANPRLSGLTFGLRYPEGVAIVAHGACGDFELCQPGWPRSGYGTALSFNAPRTGMLEQVYWLAIGVEDVGLSSVELIAHPMQGASFADDTIPARLDPITDFGSLGIGALGYAPCPGEYKQAGACCLLDGNCFVLTEDACAARQGYYSGHESECAPQLCVDLVGACCSPNRRCTVLRAPECHAIEDAVFLGWDTSCDVNFCPNWDVDGACCLDDGSCVWATQAWCMGENGLYLGNLDVAACDPDPCPADPSTGACCLLGGACRISTEDECRLVQGVSWTSEVSCEPNICPTDRPGACCSPTGSCYFTTESRCVDGAPPLGFFLGEDTVCDPSPCSLPSESGACCALDGFCQVMLECLCNCSGSTYLGHGVLCEPMACVDPSTGACCLADGDCVVAIESVCAANVGIYQGDDTVCHPDPCPSTSGPHAQIACCFADGTCVLMGDNACAIEGGVARATSATCDPWPCPAISPSEEVSWGEVKHRYR